MAKTMLGAPPIPPPATVPQVVELEPTQLKTVRSGALELPTIPVKDLAPAAAAQAPRKRVWCGALPHSAYQNTSLGGVSFNRFWEEDRKGPQGPYKVPHLGEVHELTDAQIEHALKHVALHVIRPNVNGKTGTLEVRDALYIPDAHDRAIAEDLYLVILPANLPDGWRAEYPPSIAEATRRAAKADAEKAA